VRPNASMNRLEIIDKEGLKQALRARPGYEYDQAEYLIDQASYLVPLAISDEIVFRNLIPSTWVFAENERPRTLEWLVRQLRERSLTWGQLAVNPPPVQKGEWFQRAQVLCDQFVWDRMGPVFVTPVKGRRRKGRNEGDELEPSPTASFTIVSGLHCSLAAMTRIEEKTTTFRPVEAILVLPRVDY
jgi:hypothetical protein